MTMFVLIKNDFCFEILLNKLIRSDFSYPTIHKKEYKIQVLICTLINPIL